jgi:UDP:flavonoid glycosyltransferase YjiC (YdhE family)
MLAHADVAIHHGGNNSLQEALAAGVGQVVLPFSTDQFANAADLERAGVGVVHPPNDVQIAPLVAAIERVLDLRRPKPIASPSRGELVDSLFAASSPQQNTGDLAGSGRR